ncbi:nuclear pore complex subunit Nro1-domain-containing protein [Kickxella alabastrina]|uniref:nuclear pore complex subunit Nro1-domain-containing protein n=1 Tax=Kickxella alabastrina TaxID=61397 RepID=UPI002221102B|nr:nuclear pore complex subunit Nro1-domain-containing protein [Kickxella alabastrina]KAI7824903.1 nuclear pore complex subunit Nro1-domain-containing protein [Kickxella alabastrina]
MPSDTNNNTASSQKKKRPMGLKARATKKQKTTIESATSSGAQVVDDFGDETTATIMLKNDGEEANELDELEGIFDGALEALNADDPTKAITLLRGTIHECDRILRVNDEEEESMDSRFYYIYGMALYCISEFSEGEKMEYLGLAKQRLETAEELQEEVGWKVMEGLAKVALDMLAEGAEDVSIHDVVGRLEGALGALSGQASRVAETLGMADMVLALADSKRLEDFAATRLVAWAQAALEGLPEPHDDAIKTAIARALWISANLLLEQQDEETGEVPEKPRLIVILQRAGALVEGIVDLGEALLLRGEVFLNLGNLLDKEEEQEEAYGKAVECFNGAKALGELPEQFAQFLEDFENGGIDDDEDDEDED